MRTHKDFEVYEDVMMDTKPMRDLGKKKKFDIEKIFDKTFKPGQPVKMGKKEKGTTKEKLVNTRQMSNDVSNKSYKTYKVY
jgi:hypothetical protein